MRDYLIQVDVLEAVQDFYPGLSLEDATKIAERIEYKWDYTQMYDGIADDIIWYADSFDIDLEGKEGIIEDDVNEVATCIADGTDYSDCVDRLVEKMP